MNHSLEANTEAVGRLFEELDSLKTKHQAYRLVDSIQVRLGKEIRDSFPDLLSFRLSSISFFDATKNASGMGWEATCQFSKKQPATEMKQLIDRLKVQLPGDTLVLTLTR
jgi:hypothetical protein